MTNHALILVDLQNDFLPGGALEVPGGDEVIPVANRLMDDFEIIVATQDWHPADHGSFAANHLGKQLFEQIDLNGLTQTLWPIHCVQDTPGADFAPGLDTDLVTRVFKKGTNAEIDSYSHRNSLMNPRHLDPDLVTERARALLNMAHADDLLIMVDPKSGKPISGQFQELIDDELISIIQADSTL